jgi:hypothetical protein
MWVITLRFGTRCYEVSVTFVPFGIEFVAKNPPFVRLSAFWDCDQSAWLPVLFPLLHYVFVRIRHRCYSSD